MSAIRISKALAEVARTEAGLMNRSVAAQIEHWASIGRAVEGSMSVVEIKALFARASQGASDKPTVPARGEVDGAIVYQARIRQQDPMPRLIAMMGDSRVLEVNQRELLDAKRARQLVDYAAQRERIIHWKAVSRFAGANIKASFRKVPLES